MIGVCISTREILSKLQSLRSLETPEIIFRCESRTFWKESRDIQGGLAVCASSICWHGNGVMPPPRRMPVNTRILTCCCSRRSTTKTLFATGMLFDWFCFTQIYLGTKGKSSWQPPSEGSREFPTVWINSKWGKRITFQLQHICLHAGEKQKSDTSQVTNNQGNPNNPPPKLSPPTIRV